MQTAPKDQRVRLHSTCSESDVSSVFRWLKCFVLSVHITQVREQRRVAREESRKRRMEKKRAAAAHAAAVSSGSS